MNLSVNSLRFTILLILCVLCTACSSVYQGDEYTFTAPPGFKTQQNETPQVNSENNAVRLIFSQKGHLFFQVFRQEIPPESDLETIIAEYMAQIREPSTHYQFISQNTIALQNRTAIEVIYREFSGEPYVQRREIWVKYNNRAYVLSCTDPADATPGTIVPVPDLCIRLVEGFQFK